MNDPAPDWVINYGEKEGSAERESGVEQLKRALEAKGAKVQVVVEPGADHADGVWALGDPATPTYRAVASMIERNTRNSQ